jgi:hypothetical protein
MQLSLVRAARLVRGNREATVTPGMSIAISSDCSYVTAAKPLTESTTATALSE